MKNRDLYIEKREHIKALIGAGSPRDICADCGDDHYRTCGICGDSICGDCLNEIQFPEKNVRGEEFGIWCCADCCEEFEELVLDAGVEKFTYLIHNDNDDAYSPDGRHIPSLEKKIVKDLRQASRILSEHVQHDNEDEEPSGEKVAMESCNAAIDFIQSN